uniref:Uncharacterized protein n=1 Tax=Arundo donax TaxID=35708 RepID=A0A0A9AV00_ARUDO
MLAIAELSSSWREQARTCLALSRPSTCISSLSCFPQTRPHTTYLDLYRSDCFIGSYRSCFSLFRLVILGQGGHNCVIGSCHTKEFGNSNIWPPTPVSFSLHHYFKLLQHKKALLNKDVLLAQSYVH